MELGINEDIFNLTLNDIQDRMLSMGGRQLSEYGLPQSQAVDNDIFARDYRWEIDYDRDEQRAYPEQIELGDIKIFKMIHHAIFFHNITKYL